MPLDPLDAQSTRGSAAADAQPVLASDARLGDYRVIRLLGGGGMGQVYLCVHEHLRKDYALKIIAPAISRTRAAVERFRTEARVMAELDHRHIVKVHALGEAGGLLYLVMDYIAGPGGAVCTLADLLAAARGMRPAGLPQARVRAMLLQLCDALAYAHARGVVHRDLKPSNVLVAADDRVRITDFGIAHVREELWRASAGQAGSIGDACTLAAPRAADAVFGTYDYMSPEQRANQPVAAAGDVYAIGVMLYELLTGAKPLGHWRLPSAHGCARAWDAIVTRCLQQDPRRRYAGAAELGAAITALRLRRAHTTVHLALAATVLAVAGATLWWLWPQPPARLPAPLTAVAVRATNVPAVAPRQAAVPAQVATAAPSELARTVAPGKAPAAPPRAAPLAPPQPATSRPRDRTASAEDARRFELQKQLKDFLSTEKITSTQFRFNAGALVVIDGNRSMRLSADYCTVEYARRDFVAPLVDMSLTQRGELVADLEISDAARADFFTNLLWAALRASRSSVSLTNQP